MVRMAMVVAASIAVSSGHSLEPVARGMGHGAASITQRGSTDCVLFQSPTRLAAGTPFRTALLRGLEFRLSAGWDISVGPAEEPTMDYLWVVSPPLRTAPHRMIGPGYGMTARESARIERPLRFVLTRADYDAARAAIDLASAGETLTRLEGLGRGHLSFAITDYRIRDKMLPDGRQGDAFEWITFKGEACVPKQGAGQQRMSRRADKETGRSTR
jgi:hypothetical protein